jgi:hypothetical protein
MIDSALFVSEALHEKKVILPDGSEHTLWFKELPAVEFRKFAIAEASEDESVQANSMAKLIAASLCEPDGKPALTLKDAQRLTASAMTAIASAIMEVNGFSAKNG